MIKISFPDGSVREYESGITPLQVAESISSRLAQEILCASINDQIVELNYPITGDAAIKLHKWDDAEAKHAFWHTSSHLMAEALQELYPGIQFGIGPAIENGFYYDVMPPEGVVIKDTDFPAIENKMMELRAKKEQVVKNAISKADALKAFGDKGQTYKCELISELEDGHISTYTQGAFTDLCKGPHLLSTEPIKAVKVLSCSAAYWRGDEKRPMMTRIYGISFPKKAMLDEYLALLEEAKKRDHRKIGKELELFMFSDMVGKGLPCPTSASGGLPQEDPEALRLPAGHHPAYRLQTAVYDFRSLGSLWQGLLPTDHHTRGRRGIYAQADELPAPLCDLQEQPQELQGSAFPLRGVRYGLSVRAVG